MKIGAPAEAALRPYTRHSDTTVRERAVGVLKQITPSGEKREATVPRTGGVMDTLRKVTGGLKKKD